MFNYCFESLPLWNLTPYVAEFLHTHPHTQFPAVVMKQGEADNKTSSLICLPQNYSDIIQSAVKIAISRNLNSQPTDQTRNSIYRAASMYRICILVIQTCSIKTWCGRKLQHLTCKLYFKLLRKNLNFNILYAHGISLSNGLLIIPLEGIKQQVCVKYK